MRARTPDQARRALREELHAKRCKDNDHSTERIRSDGNALDLELWHLKMLVKRTTWCGIAYEKKES